MPLSPYLAHLYAKSKLLKSGEQEIYYQFMDIQNYGGSESDSGKESEGLDLPAPSLADSPRPSKLNQPKGMEEKPTKKERKVGSFGPSGPEDKMDTRMGDDSKGILKLRGYPWEEILKFCNEIVKPTVMLTERKNSMDGML